MRSLVFALLAGGVSGWGAHGARRPLALRAARAYGARPSASAVHASFGQPNAGARALRATEALWNFTRPHTLIGSAICIPALHLFAAPAGVPLPVGPLLRSIAFAMLPSLFINVYIVGLNQIYDIEADKVNKPYLPLAAGEFSRARGVAIVGGCLALGLGIGFLTPTALATGPLKATLLGSTLLGTAYSLPPLRLKRFPLLAGLCITAVRGALINWGFFAHASEAVFNLGGASAAVARASAVRCAAATSFFLLFGIVIALLKDVPDVAGDAAVGTATYSLRFGRARVFALATGVLQAAFCAVGLALGGAACGLLGPADAGRLAAARRLVGAAVAVGFAAAIRRLAARVDVESPEAVYAFYMKCWAAFYASYAWLPLAR